MTEIKIKRVYEDFSEADGCRVLVDRLWPRGMKKEYLKYDIWAKEITPSPNLRKWFHGNMDQHWDEFASLYKKELESSIAVKAFIEQISKYRVVTLLYASKESMHNHARILQQYLQAHLK